MCFKYYYNKNHIKCSEFSPKLQLIEFKLILKNPLKTLLTKQFVKYNGIIDIVVNIEDNNKILNFENILDIIKCNKNITKVTVIAVNPEIYVIKDSNECQINPISEELLILGFCMASFCLFIVILKLLGNSLGISPVIFGSDN